jgi:osmotically-inducible protein OsmY
LEKTMISMKRISAVFLAVAFASALGCAGDSRTESTGEYVDDSWITTKVKAALVESPAVKATEVNVETFKGSVQLSGFVSSSAAMNEAVRVTNTIKGVTSVKNDMRVK